MLGLKLNHVSKSGHRSQQGHRNKNRAIGFRANEVILKDIDKTDRYHFTTKHGKASTFCIFWGPRVNSSYSSWLFAELIKNQSETSDRNLLSTRRNINLLSVNSKLANEICACFRSKIRECTKHPKKYVHDSGIFVFRTNRFYPCPSGLLHWQAGG